MINFYVVLLDFENIEKGYLLTGSERSSEKVECLGCWNTYFVFENRRYGVV